MAEITEKRPIILVKGSNEKNNHSAIDAIGHYTISIPQDILFTMKFHPDWQWFFPNDSLMQNEANYTFIKLNPQFDPKFRAQYGKHPPLPINKDGRTLDNVPGYPESHTPEFAKHLIELRKRYEAGDI